MPGLEGPQVKNTCIKKQKRKQMREGSEMIMGDPREWVRK
jgi:hypothetical protein